MKKFVTNFVFLACALAISAHTKSANAQIQTQMEIEGHLPRIAPESGKPIPTEKPDIKILNANKSDHPVFNNALSIELAQMEIGVSMGFAGSYIRVFGDRRDKDTDIIITITGPERDVTMWKKARIMGAWVNRYAAEFKAVPAYYQYAVSAPETKAGLAQVMKMQNIRKTDYINSLKTGLSSDKLEKEEFITALIDKKISQEMFFETSEPFTFLNDHFFKVHFRIPPSALTGEYLIRSYLIKNGEIIERDEDSLIIEQVGANAFLNRAARDLSLIYALVCISFALFSGWLISVIRVKP